MTCSVRLLPPPPVTASGGHFSERRPGAAWRCVAALFGRAGRGAVSAGGFTCGPGAVSADSRHEQRPGSHVRQLGGTGTNACRPCGVAELGRRMGAETGRRWAPPLLRLVEPAHLRTCAVGSTRWAPPAPSGTFALWSVSCSVCDAALYAACPQTVGPARARSPRPVAARFWYVCRSTSTGSAAV
jgi:hypothetical protein